MRIFTVINNCLCEFFSAVDVGTSVLQVEARDPDSTADVHYSIKQLTLEAKDRNGQPITNLAPITVCVDIYL